MQDEVKSGKPVTETIEQYRREHPGALERVEAEMLAEDAANTEIIPFEQSAKATDGAPKMLNAEHARRIAWDRIFKAIWESRNCLENVKYESACALADAYAADFIEKVETYTENFNAVAEELKRRG